MNILGINYGWNESLYIVGIVLVAVYLYFSGLLAYQCYLLRKFKGPVAIPILGNIYESSILSFLRHMSTLRKRFGKIFTFIAFTQPMLVVCDPVVVRRILSDPKVFPKSDDYTTYFKIAFGSSLVTSNGEKHKHDRGVFGRFFIKSYIMKFLPICCELAKEAVESKRSDATDKPLHINIEEFFALLALRTFGLFSMGIDYRKDPEREKYTCHLVSRGSFIMGQLILFRPPTWKIFPYISYMLKGRVELSNDLIHHSKERLELIAKNEAPDDCFTAMLTANMPHEEMVDHFITLLSAGHDTTAFFSSYMALLLAQHPAAQDKVYEEICKVIGDRDDITTDDLSELHYFQMCMQETLRLYAIIPIVTRVATEDVHIKEANITIPKGVKIFVPMFLINRDPDLWENPSEFIPERFESKASGDFTSAKNGYFPFGYGSRTCIGNTLAQMEAAVFFCYLLRNFRIEEEKGYKPIIVSGISLTTSNGINVVLVPRK